MCVYVSDVLKMGLPTNKLTNPIPCCWTIHVFCHFPDSRDLSFSLLNDCSKPDQNLIKNRDSRQSKAVK